METLRLALTILLGILMLVAGIAHFLKTKLYLRMIPEFFPLRIAIIQLSGAVEIALGIGLLIPMLRSWAAFGVLILMIAFLPLHVWDLFRERPAMGSRKAAWIRFPLQFVLIAWAWFAMGNDNLFTSSHLKFLLPQPF